MGTRVALVLAIVLGFIAALAVRTALEQQRLAEQRKYRPIEIVVARAYLGEGTVLTAAHMAKKQVAAEHAVGGMMAWAERLLYEGRIVTRPLQEGEPVFKPFLEEPAARKRPALESIVKEGFRAFPLRVDDVSGVAGMIRPGDYVDVIGTFDITDAGGAGPVQATKTVTLLQAARVLALDGRTMALPAAARGGAGYRTVTLEVAPWDALRLANAQARGRVQLLLRAPGDLGRLRDAVRERPVHWDVTAEYRDTIPHTRAPSPPGAASAAGGEAASAPAEGE
jgi:pilus assembly protein CpaB